MKLLYLETTISLLFVIPRTTAIIYKGTWGTILFLFGCWQFYFRNIYGLNDGKFINEKFSIIKEKLYDHCTFFTFYLGNTKGKYFMWCSSKDPQHFMFIMIVKWMILRLHLISL